MKRFIFSVLTITVLFLGLGSIAQQAGAKFKSDEKALAIVAQARQAIGGQNVKSLTVNGRLAKSIVTDGATRIEDGELELNMQMPDKFSKMIKLGKGDGSEGAQIVEKKMDVVVLTRDGKDAEFTVKADNQPGEKHVIKLRKAEAGTMAGPEGDKKDFVFIRKGDDMGEIKAENGEVRKIVVKGDGPTIVTADGHGGPTLHRQNEMLRTAVSLLITAPEGVDVGYTYVGEESVDGTSCDVINAEGLGSSFRLYLDRSTHLPKMMSYGAPKPMMLSFRIKDDAKAAVPAGEPMVFARTTEAPELARFQVKFSDFRNVGGVNLPYKWVQTVGGNDDETIDITSYDINPANIESKFQQQRVFVRTAKPDAQK